MQKEEIRLKRVEIEQINQENLELKEELSLSKQEIQAQNTEIQAIKQEIALSNKEILAKTMEIEAIKQENSEKTLEIMNSKQEILTKVTEIEALKQEISIKNQIIIAKDQDISVQKQEIFSIKEEIHSKEQEIHAKTQEIECHKQEIALTKQELEEKMREIEVQKQEIEAENHEILAMRQEIEHIMKELGSKKEEILAKVEEIEAHKQKISIKEHEVQLHKQEKEAFFEENVNLKHEKENLKKEEENLKKENDSLRKEEEVLSNEKETLESKLSKMLSKIAELEKSNEGLQKEIDYLEAILHQSKDILENRRKSIEKIGNIFEELLKNAEITEPEKKLIQAGFVNEQYSKTFDNISNLLLKNIPNLHKRDTIQFIQDLEKENIRFKEAVNYQHSNLKSLVNDIESIDMTQSIPLKQLKKNEDFEEILNNEEIPFVLVKKLKSMDNELLSLVDPEQYPINPEKYLEKWRILTEFRAKMGENKSIKSRYSQEKSELTSKITNLENALAYKDSLAQQVLTTISSILPEDEICLIEEALGASQRILHKALESQSPAYLMKQWQELQGENQILKQGILMYGLKSEGFIDNLKKYSENFLKDISN